MEKNRFRAVVLVCLAERRLGGCSTNRGPVRGLMGRAVLMGTDKHTP